MMIFLIKNLRFPSHFLFTAKCMILCPKSWHFHTQRNSKECLKFSCRAMSLQGLTILRIEIFAETTGNTMNLFGNTIKTWFLQISLERRWLNNTKKYVSIDNLNASKPLDFRFKCIHAKNSMNWNNYRNNSRNCTEKMKGISLILQKSNCLKTENL